MTYVFGVVNVFLGPVATQSLCCDLEFLCSVAKTHKAQNPQDNANSFSADVFHGANVNSLAIVSQPVAKVYTLDIQLAKFFAAGSTGHEDVEKGIFNITMTPVLALNTGNRCYYW